VALPGSFSTSGRIQDRGRDVVLDARRGEEYYPRHCEYECNHRGYVYIATTLMLASCVNEAFKLATTAAPFLSNYMMFTGDDSLYTFTFELEKKPECPVCGGESVNIEVKAESTLEDFIELLKGDQL
jgi:hypothetical protein